jgi:CRP-like cAMP-binding protein
LFLLLDGVLGVKVDGVQVAELGPGAVVGERAGLERGVRTATLWAVTPVTVAVVAPGQLDREALAEVSKGHQREDD